MEQRRILIGVTGGIAAYKVPELVRDLSRAGHAVRCVATPEAVSFVTPLVLQTLTGEPVRTALLDPAEEGAIDHIALADWADLYLVAPATANTLAKLAHGLADDLVSAVALATRAPLLVAPAMNVNMWRHPATQQNAERLRERGVRFVGPDAGELACGWEGEGRMAEPEVIAATAGLALGSRTLAADVVLVTAGGTRERVDAVRFLGNRSSGKMGFAVASEAARRGAAVVLVAAPSALATPPGVRRIDVESAEEMREAVLRELPVSTVVVMTAAVADFRPAAPAERKLKKEDLAESAGMMLELERTPDILAEICKEKADRVVVGFAAESHDLVAAARRKIARKGCDLLVANDISASGSGFDSDENAVHFVWPAGEVEELPSLPKSEVAAQLLDRVEKLREPAA
ncbi:MAG: bifunctional phosphopantothenoylcysteine decarboxylase/phosphopantothenate--cysteine ligase CoaBC [Myxococcota bacterium]|jgi:phosphopantothenoylcysteine decarboxylase/phosphopantothenate--cysteine ligase|nr:bifunctional phosphopantothenoylcysteine decarboxylase/phosphopantothenate--cysteine ligase CoaBC [Deltaproteobacteria bacterium]MCP4241252.1 bifunctional phosphopantothenoylcysteine decarboxylase/phosphopantothenate--cysteine ligase CoaBC [bacterium]MDP6074714.1 bifunctional phosphopantothenoylcysteine decarboxylase/phosphopantothenate--cysteine ligase CoaBC [Myxococcota bacterium]MDP6243642.1 bifunctional phosphopantothenoylcysteine decarboxylase/phosphopantothenate--cysteine ligase CoaBC [